MQYQVRTGPIQNNAANFSPEMVQGNAPRRSRASQGPRIGQPGVVQIADFSFESILGGNLDNRNHLTKPQHLQPAIYPHQAAAISPEMMAGAQGQTYPSPRILLGQRIPVPKSQPTHVQAAFTPSMAAGVTEPRPRILRPRDIGQPQWTFIAPVVPATGDSILASSIDSEPRLRFPQQIAPLAQPHPAAFPFDSVLASCMDSKYRLTKPQHLPPISQTTHVAAPFSIEMVSRALDLKSRQTKPIQQDIQDLIGVDAFPFDSVLASCLDTKNRLTKPQHLQYSSQLTHVPAAFQISMAAGVTAPQPRILRPRQIDLPPWVFIQRFDFDSVLASRLDSRNHLTKPQHVPPIPQPTHVAAPFSLEMVSRVLDLRSRQTKPRQASIADLVSLAPFQFESVLGSSLDFRNHLKRALQIGLPEFKHVIDFPFDSVLGSRLDSRNHLRNPFHVAPISQVSPTASPITPDMFKGWNSIPAQLKVGSLFLFYSTTGEDWGIGESRMVCARISMTAALYAALLIDPTLAAAFSANPAFSGNVILSEALNAALDINPALDGNIEIEEC